jgi:hypothetical protein
LKIKNDTEIYLPTINFGEPFDNFMTMFYRKRPYFLDVIYTTKIRKRGLNDNHISRDSYNLNYENQTIDVYTQNGYFTRKPLKDYISKEEYQFHNLSKPQYQTQVGREGKSIELEKYSLNIRGLILYILGKIDEQNSNKNENENQNVHGQNESSKNREKYRKNISSVLSNLCKYYSSNFPFLLHNNKFKEILKDVMKNYPYLRYYDVDILINIAKELESQIWFDEQFSNLDINTNNDALINFSIIKRYFSEISYYFVYLSQFLEDDKKKEFIYLFRDYQKRMLILMEEYLEKEQKSVRNLLDEFKSSNLLIS